MTKYEHDIHQLLSVYRFFSFALAAVLVQVLPLAAGETTPVATPVTLSLVGVYTALKVFSPLRWRQMGPMTYTLLGGDLAICVLLLLFSGGLDSGYLLYSLNPLITAALLLPERITLTMASVTSGTLFVAHVGLSQFSDTFAWVLEGRFLALLILYSIVSFLIAVLSYRTNLNIRNRITLDAIVEERRWLRREIHDGVAQALNYLNLKTKLVSNAMSAKNAEQALEGLQEIRKVIQDTYLEIRESLDQLSSGATVRPLVSTLAEYIQEYTQKHGIEVHLDAPETLMNLSPLAEVQMLRITQEALTNVRKHAQATKVRVKLEDTKEGVELTVKDNGHGFSIAEYEKDSTGSHGLRIIKERAQSLGGWIAIATAPGEGTEIRASFPAARVRV
ncbi:MAG: sensor histidine kinase [Dehalococcoidia bacterium]